MGWGSAVAAAATLAACICVNEVAPFPLGAKPVFLVPLGLGVSALLPYETAVEDLVRDIAGVTGGKPEAYTVADLHAFMAPKMVGRSGAAPLLRPVFHRVSRALAETLHLAPNSIRPSSQLNRLFPWQRRARLWGDFCRRLEVQLPVLDTPEAFQSGILAFVILFLFLTGLVAFGLLHSVLPAWTHAPVAVILSIAGLALATLATLRCERLLPLQFPAQARSVRDLVHLLAHGDLKTRVEWNEAMVRERVLGLVRRFVGARWREVTLNARLMDLGIPLNILQIPPSAGR